MQPMPRPRPPYLQRHVTRHGKVVWYVRKGRGPKIRIFGDYDSEEFKASYRAAVAGESPRVAGVEKDTIAWLIKLHRASKYYAEKSPSTKRKRDQIFVQVLKTSGSYPISSVDRTAIEAAAEKRKETPSQARHFVDTMRSLFKWAVEEKLAKADPTIGVRTKKPNKAGFKPWTDLDIAKFEERWPRGTRERVMFDIFIYTGLRIGDVALLGKQHIKNGVITIDTEKNGTRVTIPVLTPLALTLKEGPTGTLALVASKSGAPMLKNSLGNAFHAACKAAGVNKSAHGLRKAAATHAAEQGATVHELEAIFGWTGGAMAAHYTREANRKALAKGAMSKLDRTSMLPPEESPAPTDEITEQNQDDIKAREGLRNVK